MFKLTHQEIKRLFKYRADGVFVRKVDVGEFGRNGKAGDVVRGTFRPDGYFQVSINSERILFHRAVFFWHKGYWPKYIDHVNRVKSDNRIQNLRECEAFENSRNTGLSSKNKSGHAGVVYRPGPKRWVAFLSYGRKYTHLYCGKSKAEAIRQRKRAEKEFCNE